MTLVTNPYPIWLDARGMLADAGMVYLGLPGTDPTIEANQVAAFFDPGFTVPATQPLRLMGGVIVNGRDKAFVFVQAPDYAITVLDANGAVVSAVRSINAGGVAYQPLDPDLSAIAAIATTAFGRSLLALANAAQLKAATGVPDSLPTTGGAVTGNITRGGAGPHLYHADSALTSGRVFVTAADAADPTSAAGDIWLKKL